MSDFFLFSVQNEFRVKEPFALRRESRYPPDEEEIRLMCPSLRLSANFKRSGCQAPSSLVGTLSRICFKSSCNLGWNQYGCLTKNFKRQYHTPLNSDS